MYKKNILLENLILILPAINYQHFNDSESTLNFSVKDLVFSLFFFKKHISFQYSLLSCISGVDLLKKAYRFMLSYELLSLTFNNRLRIKIFLDDYIAVPSIIDIYKNANWWEREIWDLYGIYFQNHTDLRRILTDYGFEGYPMRKDFPLCGFYEFKYDQTQNTIISEPIVLSQEFRYFNYQMVW
jgi:NADH dehydrogenase (ubiquinone) Fe-S protein 3